MTMIWNEILLFFWPFFLAFWSCASDGAAVTILHFNLFCLGAKQASTLWIRPVWTVPVSSVFGSGRQMLCREGSC